MPNTSLDLPDIEFLGRAVITRSWLEGMFFVVVVLVEGMGGGGGGRERN